MSLDAGCRSTAKRYELHLGTINALLQRSRPAVVQGVPATKPLCSIPSLGSSYIDRAIYSQPMKRQQIDNMSSSPSPGRGDGRPVWGLGARPSQPISINPSGVHLGGASHHSSIRASRVSEHRGSAPFAPRMSSSVPMPQCLEALPPLSLPPPGIDGSPPAHHAPSSSLRSQVAVPGYQYAASCPGALCDWRMLYSSNGSTGSSTSPESAGMEVEAVAVPIALSSSCQGSSSRGSLTALSILLVNRSDSGEAMPTGGKAHTVDEEELVVVGGEAGGRAYDAAGPVTGMSIGSSDDSSSRAPEDEAEARDVLYGGLSSSVSLDAAMGPFELEEFQ